MLQSVILHFELCFPFESKVLDPLGGLFEINKDTNSTSLGGGEDSIEQTAQIKGGKFPLLGVKKDVLAEVTRSTHMLTVTLTVPSASELLKRSGPVALTPQSLREHRPGCGGT